MLINAIGQLAAAFLATIAFSVLFHVPKKQYIICGLTGTLGWLVYLLVKLYFSNTLAFMISGIFPIVPGIGIYNTIYDIMIGDAAAAMSSGLETFKAVAAIVLGIVCVFVIPNKWFRSLW